MTKKIVSILIISVAISVCAIDSTNAQNRRESVSAMLTNVPNVPSLAPYPNAKMEKAWRTVDGTESINVILLSPDNRTKVMDWYRASLSANGWKLNVSDAQNFRLTGRHNKGEFLNISASEGPSKSSRITIIYLKN